MNKIGLVLDNDGSKGTNGNPVNAQDKHNGPNQQWLVDPIKDGNIIIYDSIHNKCLDDTGIKQAGQFYQIWNCNLKNLNQQFKLKFISKE